MACHVRDGRGVRGYTSACPHGELPLRRDGNSPANPPTDSPLFACESPSMLQHLFCCRRRFEPRRLLRQRANSQARLSLQCPESSSLSCSERQWDGHYRSSPSQCERSVSDCVQFSRATNPSFLRAAVRIHRTVTHVSMLWLGIDSDAILNQLFSGKSPDLDDHIRSLVKNRNLMTVTTSDFTQSTSL